MKLRNPFTRAGKWYKANLHAHTTTSDGGMDCAQLARRYRREGYQVLAITDHRSTNDVSGLSSRNFLVVSGLEYHPRCPSSSNAHHLVAINVPHGFGFADRYPADGNAAIRAVRRAGGETILAHPYWCGHRWEMYSYLKGYVAVEVYNTTCDRRGRAASEADWAHHLVAGRIIPAVAVDDCHGKPGAADYFGGWTWLKLPGLTVRSVMGALRSGCYYASTGPRIHDFRVRGGSAELRCSPVETIYLMGYPSHGERRRAGEGKGVRKLAVPVAPGWKYVRGVVVDHRGRKAWTNPIVL